MVFHLTRSRHVLMPRGDAELIATRSTGEPAVAPDRGGMTVFQGSPLTGRRGR